MAKKKGIPVIDQIAALESEIDKERKKWDYYKVHGGSDGWPDGVALNLTRNHIIYYLMEIARLKAGDSPLQLSFLQPFIDDWGKVDKNSIMKDKRIPPEVSWNLMVTDRVPIY